MNNFVETDMKKITIVILTLLALLLTACGGASTSTEEAASAVEATAIADMVTTMQTATAAVEELPTEAPVVTATLTSDYENAAPILMQVVLGIYQLEDTTQVVTAAQAQELLSLLTTLSNASSGNTIAQDQIDALVEQAVSVLTPEQIQAIANMQITQDTTMSVMQELGLSMGGPGQGESNPPSGDMGGPPQGDPGGTPPEGGPGGQPPADGQMGTPPADGMQRGAGFVPPELLNAIIEFLQTKIAS